MKKILAIIYILCFKAIISQVPTNGLLGYYPFNGNANDLSGNAQNGTVYGAALAMDRFGNSNSAYSFNGISNYIELPAGTFTTLNIYTYSCWIKPVSSVGGFAMCFGESSFGYCQTLAYQSTGSITAGAYNCCSNPTQSLIHSSSTYSINQWIHILMTRDYSNIKLYVNGTLFSSSSANTNGQNASYGTNNPIRAYIGARTTSISYFNGLIDDVRIYSTALSQSEVTALFNESCIQNATASATICAGNSASLIALQPQSNIINWHSSPTSSSSIATGTLFLTPVLSAGIYTYYASASACSLTSQHLPFIVTVKTTPTLSANNGVICSGNSFTILPTGASTYTFSSGSSVVSPTVGTSYLVTGSNTLGCSSSTTISITVNPIPTIVVSNGAVCPGNSYTINPSGATSYTFSGGSNIVSPSVTSSYSVIGSLNGCNSIIPAVSTVSVVNSLTLSVSGNTNICAGQPANLIGNGASTYSWSNGVIGNFISITPSVSANFTLTGMSGNCLSTMVVTVSIIQLPVVTVNGGSICLGESFLMQPQGAVTYSYSSGTPIVTPIINTTYSVSGTSSNGCVSNNAISEVTVNALPFVTASSSSSLICNGESASLIANGAVSYSWNTGSTNASISVSPSLTTTYTVTGQDVNSCKNSTFIVQMVDPCNGFLNLTAGTVKVLVYPNPNDGIFIIEYDHKDINKILLEDINGKLLYTYIPENDHRIEIKNTEMKPGVYFCRIMSNQKTILTKKLIIMK